MHSTLPDYPSLRLVSAPPDATRQAVARPCLETGLRQGRSTLVDYPSMSRSSPQLPTTPATCHACHDASPRLPMASATQPIDYTYRSSSFDQPTLGSPHANPPDSPSRVSLEEYLARSTSLGALGRTISGRTHADYLDHRRVRSYRPSWLGTTRHPRPTNHSVSKSPAMLRPSDNATLGIPYRSTTQAAGLADTDPVEPTNHTMPAGSSPGSAPHSDWSDSEATHPP
jgi:hypothetical protein